MFVRMFVGIAIGLAVALPPKSAQAGEPNKPQRPNPEVLFQRLDKNRDKVITAEEIPPEAQEELKVWLKKLDTNADKKVTSEEFKEGLKAHGLPVPLRAFGLPPGPSPATRPKTPLPPAKLPPKPPLADAQRRMPDPKTLFTLMDKNKDNSLSLEEFATGMKEFYRRLGKDVSLRPAAGARHLGPGWRRGLGFAAGPRWRPAGPWRQARPWGPPPWWSIGCPWWLGRGGRLGWIGHGPIWGHRPWSDDGRPWRPEQLWSPMEQRLKQMVAAAVREEVQKIRKELTGVRSEAKGGRSNPEQKK